MKLMLCMNGVPKYTYPTAPVKNGRLSAALHDNRVLLDMFLKKIKCTNGFVRSNVFGLPCLQQITEVGETSFFRFSHLALNSGPKIYTSLKTGGRRSGERD